MLRRLQPRVAGVRFEALPSSTGAFAMEIQVLSSREITLILVLMTHAASVRHAELLFQLREIKSALIS